jgi:hypothetical protein
MKGGLHNRRWREINSFPSWLIVQKVYNPCLCCTVYLCSLWEETRSSITCFWRILRLVLMNNNVNAWGKVTYTFKGLLVVIIYMFDVCVVWRKRVWCSYLNYIACKCMCWIMLSTWLHATIYCQSHVFIRCSLSKSDSLNWWLQIEWWTLRYYNIAPSLWRLSQYNFLCIVFLIFKLNFHFLGTRNENKKTKRYHWKLTSQSTFVRLVNHMTSILYTRSRYCLLICQRVHKMAIFFFYHWSV